MGQISGAICTLKSLGRFFFIMERRAKATFDPMAILIVGRGIRGIREMKLKGRTGSNIEQF